MPLSLNFVENPKIDLRKQKHVQNNKIKIIIHENFEHEQTKQLPIKQTRTKNLTKNKQHNTRLFFPLLIVISNYKELMTANLKLSTKRKRVEEISQKVASRLGLSQQGGGKNSIRYNSVLTRMKESQYVFIMREFSQYLTSRNMKKTKYISVKLHYSISENYSHILHIYIFN